MHVIFLLHGMGNSNTGWAEKAKALIRKHYDKRAYAFLDGWSFDATFKFHELNYNQIFDDYLAEAKKQSEKLGDWNKLAKLADGTVVSSLGRILKLASAAPNKDNFLVTHVADVLLYMATDLGELVKNRIADQITKRLEADDYDAGADEWSVVAHSLGTRVMTEVLNIGFSAAPSLRSFGKAKVVAMIANTSKLLEGFPPYNAAGNVYHNIVFPADSANGVCEHYVNATHRLDPFAFIREFDPPPDFGDKRVFTDGVYHPIKLAGTDVTSKDVHSLEHYLEHPLVHTALYRYLLPGNGKRGPTKLEMDAALAAYHQKTLLAGVSGAWREALARLKDEKEPSVTFDKIVDVWEKYGALLK